MQHIAIKPEFEWAARLGYASRGAIYLVIGSLAVLAAFTAGGKTTGSKGALQTIVNQPFGQTAVAILIVGLVCYAAWRVTQALTDTENHGHDAKGSAARIGMFASAIAHLALALWAASLLIDGVSSQGSSNDSFFSSPLGQWVLGAIGMGILIAGLVFLVRGFTASFEKKMEFPTEHIDWMRPLCRFGIASRGLVYVLIGSFILVSVWRATDGEMKGVGDALSWLGAQPYGSWALGIVAIGLFAFGVYSILEATYRRVES